MVHVPQVQQFALAVPNPCESYEMQYKNTGFCIVTTFVLKTILLLMYKSLMVLCVKVGMVAPSSMLLPLDLINSNRLFICNASEFP